MKKMMMNLDSLKQQRTAIQDRMRQALADNNPEAFGAAWEELQQNLQDAVMSEARAYNQQADVNILAARGVRQLTSGEREYYQQVIGAMRSSNPRQALADLEPVLPITTINAVFDDLRAEHPLLDVIGFQNTNVMTEFLLNTNTKQLASWSPLTSEITKELEGGFKKVTLTMNKLSAWFPVAKSMLDLGPEWLDRYVREVLAEALAFGLEEALINGTGKNEPIGMMRQVGEGVTVTDGVYPVKTAIEMDSFEPVAYGDVLSKLAKDGKGNPRAVRDVVLIVNPADYLTKVMPATTIRGADGRYVNDVLPFPTRVIQSQQMPKGKAVIGLAKRYFMGVGTGKDGKIEYSDDYRFLEDFRVYLVKLHGHGEPLDNNAFLLLDISGLKPLTWQVYVTNADDLPTA